MFLANRLLFLFKNFSQLCLSNIYGYTTRKAQLDSFHLTQCSLSPALPLRQYQATRVYLVPLYFPKKNAVPWTSIGICQSYFYVLECHFSAFKITESLIKGTCLIPGRPLKSYPAQEFFTA